MKTFAQIEEVYTFEKVTYYSVRREDTELNELERFIERYEDDLEVAEEFQDLFAWIKYIGDEEGANLILFRDESSAQALPPEMKIIRKRNRLKEIGYRLRLYCIRIDERIVVLLDGGVKETQKVQGDPDLLSKFRLANKISEAITEKMILGELWVEGHSLQGDFELFI